MTNQQYKIKGVVVPMVTPVTRDFQIDEVAIKKILKTFTENAISPFLLGTTGESTSLSESQKITLVKNVIDSNPEGIPVYAGISSNSVLESLNQGNIFADLGVSAAVAHLPFYYPMSEDDMLWYFEELANNIPCPLVLYNNPITVKSSIPLAVIEKLSYHENIIGFKDSERGMERLDEAISLWKSRDDFSFLLGWAAQSAYAVLNGCDGIVPSTGNLTPELYDKLYKAAVSGNEKEANELQVITNEISLIYQENRNISQSIPALKTLMSAFQLCEPYAIPPMRTTIESEQQTLIQLITEKLQTIPGSI